MKEATPTATPNRRPAPAEPLLRRCRYRIAPGRLDVLPGTPVGAATYHVYDDSLSAPSPVFAIIWTGTWGECVNFVRDRVYADTKRAAVQDGADGVEAHERAQGTAERAIRAALSQTAEPRS